MVQKYKFYWTLLALIFTSSLNAVSNFIIFKYFPDRLKVDDLLFRLTPYISWTQYLTDIANIFSVLLLIIYVIKGHVKKLPYYFTTFALMELMRAVFVVLTPLGTPLVNGPHYGLTTIHQHGEFPSGHTALVVLCFLLVNKKDSSVIKTLLLISVIVEIVSLVLSRGHYSIDIVGGILIAFVSFTIMKKYENWFSK